MLHQFLPFSFASVVQDASEIAPSIFCTFLEDADIASCVLGAVTKTKSQEQEQERPDHRTHCSCRLQPLHGPCPFPFAFRLNQLVLLLHEYQSFFCPLLLQLLTPRNCSLTMFWCCPLHVLLAHHQIFQDFLSFT